MDCGHTDQPSDPNFYRYDQFRRDLIILINKHGVDSDLSTADYVVASYMMGALSCLLDFHEFSKCEKEGGISPAGTTDCAELPEYSPELDWVKNPDQPALAFGKKGLSLRQAGNSEQAIINDPNDPDRRR